MRSSRIQVRCFLLVRDPIERFLSYYRERTAGAPARFLEDPGWRRSRPNSQRVLLYCYGGYFPKS